MGSRDGRLDVFARTRARKEPPGGPKHLEDGLVFGPSLRLGIRGLRAATIGPLLPLDPEPPQVLQKSRHKFRSNPVAVQVFVAKDQSSATGLGPLMSHPEGPRMAQMQLPRG